MKRFLKRLIRLISIVTVLATVPSILIAQDPEPPASGDAPFSLDSDRPGLGDGAHVLAPGVWQAEFGGQYMSGGAARFSVGQGLLRGGFTPFELRLYANSLVIEQNAGSSGFGFEDLGLGVKVPVGGPGRWNWAVLGLVTLPTGGDDYSAHEVTGGATLIGQTNLTGSISLALNGGYSAPFNAVGDGRFAVIVTPGVVVPGVPEMSVYAGVASYLGHGDDANFFEAGLAYTRDADTQLDLNWGIDTDSRDWFLGVGWARRWR